ncbi:fimbrial protein [Phocaeicola barnesiae]|uniref:fimbrial protein n=1 Tax=Phocaeicola barnesiae TaxID=376804 RepID=UPI000365A42E|nr:fimbrial protein [Phocaeicola barnesiae]
MINKHSIYNWLFFPLLASLLAGSVASCINDPAMEEDTSGKSTLSITVRGVTTTVPTDGDYDEYIKTLRIIGFDEKGVVVCNEQHSTTDFLIENGVLNITQTMEDAFQGGVCDFYFVANEDGYNVHDTQSTARTLSAFLSAESWTKDELMNCVIAYTRMEPGATNQLPILMTTSVRTTLRPGENTINNIELVRCFAKVQLKIIDQTNSAKVGDNPVLEVTYPSYYSLWDESQDANWTSNDAEVNIDLVLGKGTIEQDGQSYVLHTSQEIYFPERLFTTEDNKETNALKFSFTLNGESYTAAVADETGTDLDFNIRRNTHYTVIATLKKKETVTFNILVNAWDGKTMDVPAFE